MEIFACPSTQRSGLLSPYSEPGAKRWQRNGDKAGTCSVYGPRVRSGSYEGATSRLWGINIQAKAGKKDKQELTGWNSGVEKSV